MLGSDIMVGGFRSAVVTALMAVLLAVECGGPCLAADGGVYAKDTAPKPAAGAGVVLDSAGVWRMYHTLKPPVLQQPDGALKPCLMNVKWLDWETPPPAADWTKPEMNDRTWMRGPVRRSARTPYLARLSMRGKFEVTNPSAVGDLSLALEYQGGVVVYLNGKEVGRKNVPVAKDSAAALADAYPLEAFVDGQGNLLGVSRGAPAPTALRTRSFTLALPQALLRQGLNVLAIDIIRAPYPANTRAGWADRAKNLVWFGTPARFARSSCPPVVWPVSCPMSPAPRASRSGTPIPWPAMWTWITATGRNRLIPLP